MALTIQELIHILQQIAPDSLAESWDNVGLLVGNPQQPVTSILLALDPSPSLVHAAAAQKCDLIITHHPAIFRPLKSIRTDHPTGLFVAEALRRSIGVIGCHTNLDSTLGGVSDVLAQGLGLKDSRPLIAGGKDCEVEGMCGLGRIGSYTTPITAEEFISRLRRTCSPPWLLEAGVRPESISSVAVCGGSCGDFAETAADLGADVFVTAEIKHSVARWAEDAGFWLIDGGHFATEQPTMAVLAEYLEQELQKNNTPVPISTAEQQAPLRLIHESISPEPEN